MLRSWYIAVRIASTKLICLTVDLTSRTQVRKPVGSSFSRQRITTIGCWWQPVVIKFIWNAKSLLLQAWGKMWTGLFFGLFFFWSFYGGGGKDTIRTKGCSLSALREGWEAQCYYLGRGERRTITTQWRVGGGCNSKRCWWMELLINHTNCFNRFFDWPFFFFFFFYFVMRMQNCHLNTGLSSLLKISRLRSSTVELCVWLLSE